jgi:hypothetical protein
MEFVSLESVQECVAVNAPLPFNVRNADKTLLLARGQIVRTAAQMNALFQRGALVDAAEVQAVSPDPQTCSPAQLPTLWDKGFQGAGAVLASASAVAVAPAGAGDSAGTSAGTADPEFPMRLDRTAQLVADLVERDPDLAIFWIVRPDRAASAHYGSTHSMHAAVTAKLAANRLGWDARDALKVLKAALTMNVSMLALQDVLAKQPTPPTPEQRELIRTHPLRSAEILRSAGITDTDILAAVTQHHERPDGTGYPEGRTEITEMAALLRRADMFTAKLSARATRRPLAAPDAARTMFLQEKQHPMMAAIVKEFGVYPPGCCVRLASGECGLVIKRGPTANSPVVASALTKSGRPILEPRRRDTAMPAHAIVELLDEKNSYVSVTREWLAAALSTETTEA